MRLRGGHLRRRRSRPDADGPSRARPRPSPPCRPMDAHPLVHDLHQTQHALEWVPGDRVWCATVHAGAAAALACRLQRRAVVRVCRPEVIAIALWASPKVPYTYAPKRTASSAGRPRRHHHRRRRRCRRRHRRRRRCRRPSPPAAFSPWMKKSSCTRSLRSSAACDVLLTGCFPVSVDNRAQCSDEGPASRAPESMSTSMPVHLVHRS